MAAAVAFRQSNRSELESDTETRDTLFLLGGLSMILFGAGLVLTNPAVKKLMGQTNVGGLLQSALPDLERYLKIRSM
ncbi:MAG TPA: hypothetical protein VML19_33115 [Verrucomicrobiae bacterium]|nr:hypothetical protein [Verrucomicrobiae bacterium]